MTYKKIILFVLLAGMSLGITGYAYAWSAVPNISKQERIRTETLLKQLKKTLDRNPTKAKSLAEKYRKLEIRAKNAQNKRVYARLRESASSYGKTGTNVAKTAVSPSAVTAVPGFQGVIVDANVPKGKVAAKAPAPSAVSATGSQTMPQTASGAGQTGSQTILQPPSGNGQTVWLPGREVWFEELKTIVGKYVEVDDSLRFTENGTRKQLLPQYVSAISETGKSRIFDHLDYKPNIIYKTGGKYFYANRYSITDVGGETPASGGNPWTVSSLSDIKTLVWKYAELGFDIFDSSNRDPWWFTENGIRKVLSADGSFSHSMTQDDLLKFINYKLLRGESVAKIAVAQYQKDGSPYYAVADAYSILDYAEGIDHDYYVQSKQQGTLWDYEKTLLEIKSLTNGLIQWASSDDEKTRKIYKWITTNISYDYSYLSNFNSSAEAWVGTYKARSGVCGWFAHLLAIMLEYANIQNVHIMSGHVWSSKGGTINNGHAWVRISDSYYDTTWDVGKTDGFVWYGLPKDFIDARNTDTYPKSLSENQYDTYYRAQLLSLAKKYQWQGYVLLVPYELMNSLGITPETVLSDDEFTTKLKMVVTKYVEATDGKFTFSENGKIYRIVERGGTLTPSFNDFMSWNPHYGDIGLQALIHTPNEMYTLTTGGFDVVQVTP